MKFDAPYEALFLLPEALCKSCGTKIPQDTENCPKCGSIFHWYLREKTAIEEIMAYVSAGDCKEEKARLLQEFKARKWCKKHGFQRTLTLPKDGKEIVVCIHCLAHAMIMPHRRPQSDYERENHLCRGTHG